MALHSNQACHLKCMHRKPLLSERLLCSLLHLEYMKVKRAISTKVRSAPVSPRRTGIFGNARPDLLRRWRDPKSGGTPRPCQICRTNSPNQVHGNTHVGTVAKGVIEAKCGSQSASEVQQNRNKKPPTQVPLQDHQRRVPAAGQRASLDPAAGDHLDQNATVKGPSPVLGMQAATGKKARPKPQQDTEIDEDEESLSRPKLS